MKNIKAYKSYHILAVSVILFALMFSGSCSKSNNNNGDTPGANEVFIQNMAFVPNTITVTAGTTITWTNKDAIAHTVTSNTALFNSGSLATGKTFTYTFSAAGTYSYYCSIHPTMVASVTVN
jgi:plastocyanin